MSETSDVLIPGAISANGIIDMAWALRVADHADKEIAVGMYKNFSSAMLPIRAAAFVSNLAPGVGFDQDVAAADDSLQQLGAALEGEDDFHPQLRDAVTKIVVLSNEMTDSGYHKEANLQALAKDLVTAAPIREAIPAIWDSLKWPLLIAGALGLALLAIAFLRLTR